MSHGAGIGSCGSSGIRGKSAAHISFAVASDPQFEPGTTDLRSYAKKLEFLRDLWPSEHIEHLAPRAALMVEGVGFQKVALLSAEKLRCRDGVQYLVEALGGQWGRLEEEDRYDLFERALYSTQQKADESHDSYLNRHDVAFEDLVTKQVKIEEVRAYVMIRQSALNAEDRKKIIMDCGGKLKYEEARRSIRLLGSRFFQDLQTQARPGRGKRPMMCTTQMRLKRWPHTRRKRLNWMKKLCIK